MSRNNIWPADRIIGIDRFYNIRQGCGLLVLLLLLACQAQSQTARKHIAANGAASSGFLFAAASAGSVDQLARLVKRGVSVTSHDAQGKTALHYAATAGREAAVRWLVTHGADVNAGDVKGETPLGAARAASLRQDAGARSDQYAGIIAYLTDKGAHESGENYVASNETPSATTAVQAPAHDNPGKQTPNGAVSSKDDSIVLSILGKPRDVVERILGDPIRKTNQTPKQKAENVYLRAIYRLPGYKEAWISWTHAPDWLMGWIRLTPLDENPTWEAALKQLGLKTEGVSLQNGRLLNAVGLPNGYKAYWFDQRLHLTQKE